MKRTPSNICLDNGKRNINEETLSGDTRDKTGIIGTQDFKEKSIL